MLSSPENQGLQLTYYSIDMDGLKTINDQYGHDEGDRAIVALAHAIAAVMSGRGAYARYGGDEFACAILTDYSGNAFTPESIRVRLRSVLDRDRTLIGRPYQVAASIGSCSGQISRELSLEDMIRQADSLMYTEKQNRRAAR